MAVLQLALTFRPGFIEEEKKEKVNILISVCACRLFIFNIRVGDFLSLTQLQLGIWTRPFYLDWSIYLSRKYLRNLP